MTGPEMSRTELEAIAQAGKNAEAALLAIGAGPGPEFAAACRLILSGDTPDLVNAVLRMTPIREDVERIAIDIIAVALMAAKRDADARSRRA
jgi:hypothetical protein